MSGYRFPTINILKIAVGKTSLWLSGCLSVGPSVGLFVRLSVCLSVGWSVGLSVCPSVCLSVWLSVCLLFFLPFHLT